MVAAADILRSDIDLKAWKTLVARAALKGWQLYRTDPDDGVQRFFAGRFDYLIRALRDPDEVLEFLDHIEG